jgi:transposase
MILRMAPLAAWLGLTPSQYSSGGKSKLGRITKAGDSYLRTLLVQGARSVLIGAEKRTDLFSRWVCSLVERRGYWRAVVTAAAKTAGHHCITVMISGYSAS